MTSISHGHAWKKSTMWSWKSSTHHRSKVNTYHFSPDCLESRTETSFKTPKVDLPAWKIRHQFITKLNACKLLIVKAPTGPWQLRLYLKIRSGVPRSREVQQSQ